MYLINVPNEARRVEVEGELYIATEDVTVIEVSDGLSDEGIEGYMRDYADWLNRTDRTITLTVYEVPERVMNE